MVSTLENPMSVAHKQRVLFLIVGPDARYATGIQAGSYELILPRPAAHVAVPHSRHFPRGTGSQPGRDSGLFFIVTNYGP